MSKIGYHNLTPELEDKFFRSITQGDRFTNSRLRRINKILSRGKKVNLVSRSLLPEVSNVWGSLSDYDKAFWSAAGTESNLNGWKLFIQDYGARKKAGLTGIATPSLLHQTFVGKIEINSPATEVKLIQEHPRNYYIKRKLTNKKESFSPVLITENLSLPFNLSLNYKSDLEVVGPEPFAKVYARFWYSFKGENLYYYLEIPLDLVTDWKNSTIDLLSLDSIIIRYDLVIHIHDLQGVIFFDNLKLEHSGQNFARDPFCQNINEKFSGNFYQVIENWKVEILPNGANFFSTYQDF
jgi:hypothetical protein